MIHKNKLYPKEQRNILNQLISILDLDEENSTTLYELDTNEIKKQNILNLIPDIRKYYSFSNVIGIKEPTKCQRPYLSIIKCITKSDYVIKRSDFRIKMNNDKTQIVRTKKYVFVKK